MQWDRVGGAKHDASVICTDSDYMNGLVQIDCECDDKSDACADIECKVDRDGAPDDEDIYLSCSATLGAAPQCNFAPLNQAESSIDTCVVDTVKTVLSEWYVGFE